MSWSTNNLSWTGGSNYAAFTAPNYAVYSAPNYAVYSAPNYAAHPAGNYAAHSAPNYAVHAGPVDGAQALRVLPGSNAGFNAAPGPGGGTGAGGASGAGFAGGYGVGPRFEYATPAALGPLPWALDFAHGDGWPSFPVDWQLDPVALGLAWQPADWDPALRFWTLPFDVHLTEWLQDLDLGAPAVVAAREFAARHAQWLASDGKTSAKSALHLDFEQRAGTLLDWRTDWNFIRIELEELADLMRDDRMRYMEELSLQSSHATPFFVHLLGINPATKPWTMALMNCATAIGNLVKMQYKSHYKRVRPSSICPALAPPWGPPQHPAFPSGHATVAHLMALFLLSVPGIAQRFGVKSPFDPVGRAPTLKDEFGSAAGSAYGANQQSPLLWLAWRIAKGRERLALHYASDSAAGRLLAALVWNACLGASDPDISLPSLNDVLRKARAEWPEIAGGRGKAARGRG